MCFTRSSKYYLFWFAGMTVHDPFAVYDVVDAPKERFGGEAGVWAGSN
ncbi:hypothetical protein ABZZ04_01785 [Streptomyces sp. NPDC006435]